MRGRLIAGAAALALLSIVAPAGAQLPIGGGQNPPVPIPVPSGAPPAEPYGTNDYGGFRDILPAGHQRPRQRPAARRVPGARARRPPHSNDQLSMYGDLVYATPGAEGRRRRQVLQGLHLRRASPATSSARYSPARRTSRSCATRASACPHVYGATRDGAMFGARLRRAPRTACSSWTCCATPAAAELSSFAGGAKGNRAMDAEQWALAPYTEADLQQQTTSATRSTAPRARQLQQRRRATTSPASTSTSPRPSSTRRKMPGEYAAIGQPQGPDDWKAHRPRSPPPRWSAGSSARAAARDRSPQVAAAATRFRRSSASSKGAAVGATSAALEDPEAPTTVHRQALPLPGARRSKLARGRRGAAGQGLAQGCDRRRPKGGARASRSTADAPAPRPDPRRPARVPDGDVQRAAASRARSRPTGNPLDGHRPAGRPTSTRRS